MPVNCATLNFYDVTAAFPMVNFCMISSKSYSLQQRHPQQAPDYQVANDRPNKESARSFLVDV